MSLWQEMADPPAWAGNGALVAAGVDPFRPAMPPSQAAQAADRVDVGAFSLELDTGSLDRSERLDDIFGFRPGEAGHRVDAFFARLHPEDARRLSLRALRVVPDGRLERHVRLRLPSGEQRCVLVRGDLRTHPQSRARSLTGVVVDETGREGPGSASLFARLDLATDLTGLGFWEWEPEATYSAGRLHELLGLPPGKSVGFRGLLDRIHPEDRAAVTALFGRAFLPLDGLPLQAEFRAVRKDGEVRRVRSLWRTLRGDDGTVRRVVGALYDVTAQSAALPQEELLARHDLMLKEANHRIKNSLQMVASLLALEAAVSPYPEVRRSFDEACGRILTVSRIHERLYRGERADGVGLRDYLSGLVDDLTRSLGLDGRTIRVSVTVAEDRMLAPDRLVPLALMVNELVTNAVKHAFPGNRPGEVRVETLAVGVGGSLAVTVADDGIGLPRGFDLGQSTSLGLRLVRALCRQLGASLGVECGPGTRFTLGVPLE